MKNELWLRWSQPLWDKLTGVSSGSITSGQRWGKGKKSSGLRRKKVLQLPHSSGQSVSHWRKMSPSTNQSSGFNRRYINKVKLKWKDHTVIICCETGLFLYRIWKVIHGHWSCTCSLDQPACRYDTLPTSIPVQVIDSCGSYEETIGLGGQWVRSRATCSGWWTILVLEPDTRAHAVVLTDTVLFSGRQQ